MHTIEFRKGIYAENAILSAKCDTVDSLCRLAEKLTYSKMIIVDWWQETDNGYAMDVFDWADCWTVDPPPTACIIAPPGFVPPTASRTQH